MKPLSKYDVQFQVNVDFEAVEGEDVWMVCRGNSTPQIYHQEYREYKCELETAMSRQAGVRGALEESESLREILTAQHGFRVVTKIARG